MKTNGICVALSAAIVLFVSTAVQAGALGWWRMGDSDAAPVVGETIASTINEEVGGVSAGDLADATAGSPASGRPAYSPTVPGQIIHDPTTTTNYANDWSMYINGSGAAIGSTVVRPRLLAATSPVVPSGGFTFETFLLTGSTNSSAGADFAYQNSGTNGGWRMELNGSNQIRLIMSSGSAGNGTILDLTSSTATVPGQWHHVGLIYEGNSQDASNDVHLFLDYEEVASANLADAEAFGGAATSFYVGSVLSNHVIRLDEPRYFDEVRALDGSDFLEAIPSVTLTVDRSSGSLTLNNSPLNPNSLDILGYSITSDYGSLDQAGWKPIAGNYDDSTTGNGDVDSDDEWTILSSGGSHTDLSEALFGGTPGDGGSIAPGASVVLSQGDGAWIPTPTEDLTVQILYANGQTEFATVVYEGNGGNPLIQSDFNHDGSISSLDWDIFRDNNATDLSGLSPAQSYSLGDLDGDGDNDTFDFDIFRSDYDDANGPGSFAAMLQSVPEPSTLFLLSFAGLGLCLQRNRRRIAKCVPLLLLVLFTASSASADTLTWYRMGDDDGGLTVPPVAGNPLSLTEGTLSNPLGTFGPLTPNSGVPDYSDVVPGKTIHNPQTGLNYANNWSFETDASENRERASVGGNVVPSAFSYETFVRFNDVSAAGGIDFGYHRNNTNGGWQLELNTNGTIELNMNSKISGGGLHILDLDSNTSLVDGRWYHIGVIFEGNSQDASDDAHLFIDYQLEVSGNVPDANIFGGDEITFYNGSVLNQDASLIDESRYVDEVFPLDGSGFLTLANMKSQIHPLTGELMLVNNTFHSIDLANYQINSPLGALQSGDANWNSLSDQNLDPVGGGDEPGETWEESGGSGTTALAESFLLGSTMLDPGDTISLGAAYNTALTDNDMTMSYLDLNAGGVTGSVEFAILGDMDGNGKLEDADVNPFVQALTDRAAYNAAHPGVVADFSGDMDGNGKLDLGDLADFKAAILALPANASSAGSAIPEPSTLLLLSLTLLACLARRRI